MNLLDNVRKFGLEYCDLPTMVWNVAVMMRLLLLNIDSRYKKRIPIIYYIVLVVMTFCFYLRFLISSIWFVMVKSKETGDEIYAKVVISLAISSEISFVKLFFLFMDRSKLKSLVGDYLSYDAHLDPESRFYKSLLIKLRAVKRRALTFWIILAGNGFFYVIKPLLTPGRHVMDDKFPVYGLEPSLVSPNYELNYVVNVLAITLILHIPNSVNGLLIIFCGYIESQMLTLSEEVLAIWPDSEKHCREVAMTTDSSSTNIYDEYVTRNLFVKNNLKKIINLHSAIINLLRATEAVLRVALAAGFTILIIGLIFILHGGLENTYYEIPFGFTQVAMDCYAGQRVIDSGLAFERALYNSNWENFDLANKKTIAMMVMSSQKMLKLTAGGVSTLNFVWLMSVCRTVYSAYTTLRSTSEH